MLPDSFTGAALEAAPPLEAAGLLFGTALTTELVLGAAAGVDAAGVVAALLAGPLDVLEELLHAASAEVSATTVATPMVLAERDRPFNFVSVPSTRFMWSMRIQ